MGLIDKVLNIIFSNFCGSFFWIITLGSEKKVVSGA